MVRLDTTCSVTLFAIWGIYSVAVTALWQLIEATHQSPYLAWAAAGSLAIAALVASERA
jgi:hypothetical protein